MEKSISKKIVAVIVILVLLVGALGYVFIQSSRIDVDLSQVVNKGLLTKVMYQFDSFVTRERLWMVFQNYVRAVKNHDIQELRKYAYQLSSVCNGESVSDECIARMDTAYEIASQFQKKDFVVLYYDQKQAILATTPVLYEDETTIGYSKLYLVFARKDSGAFSVAGIDPNRSWFANKSESRLRDELLLDVEEEMLDSDKDGAPDKFERCELPMNLLVLNCIETDPNTRDSNGDGWWDGVEPFLAPR